MKTDEVRKFIEDDLDWMFNVGDIQKIDIEKKLKDWDYVLKIRFNPPTPFDLKEMYYECKRFEEFYNECCKEPVMDYLGIHPEEYAFMIVDGEQIK